MAMGFVKPFDRKLELRPPRFVSHIAENGGALPDEPGAHACWYYCRIAIKSMKDVDDGAQYEGELDHTNMLNNLARSVAMLYRLDSPDDFLKFMPLVRMEAMKWELVWDERIVAPYTISFLRNSM